MRTVIWVILLFVAAVVSATVLSQNDGLVSIFYGGLRIDTSLNVAVVALVLFVIVLYVALKAINGLLSMPRRAHEWRELKRERAALDRTIADWVEQLDPKWLEGDLTWFSGAMQREMTMPKWILVTHMFNHQTHHRGQVHGMLTAAGAKPGDTDLPFMP